MTAMVIFLFIRYFFVYLNKNLYKEIIINVYIISALKRNIISDDNFNPSSYFRGPMSLNKIISLIVIQITTAVTKSNFRYTNSREFKC